MTTVVIHGTLAQGAPWSWNSWHPGGFCQELAEGMQQASGSDDVWTINGKPIWRAVAKVNTADGRFEWSGLAEGQFRGQAAEALAQYLNAIRRKTREPIRIVAHSHGCNVVKLASSLPLLSPDVHIAKAVFLACPHFWETNYVADEPQSWLDQFDIRKQILKPKGRKYRYRLSPQRFGKVLNLYSDRDIVQIRLAQMLSGGVVPQLEGGAFANALKMFSTGDVFELPNAGRTDSDPAARAVYENFEVPISRQCTGMAAHSAMHGAVVARLCGYWLGADTPIKTLTKQLGKLPEISASDTGR
jgi:hypothetical protein